MASATLAQVATLAPSVGLHASRKSFLPSGSVSARSYSTIGLEKCVLAATSSGLVGGREFTEAVRHCSRNLPQRHARGVFCAAQASSNATSPPTVADTKAAFLRSYRRPIPSLYNSVIQELIVQQHLIRYNAGYKYDPVFALGFVSVYDQLLDGYPNEPDKEAIFKAYIEALKEDPETYRRDAAQLVEWAGKMDATSLCDFSSRSEDGPVEAVLKDIAERAKSGKFHYSRLFAIGLFRLLELAKGAEPSTLEKLCSALNVNKLSVDRDLDVYRGLLNKLAQGKELLKDFLQREKAKEAEREREKAQVKAE
eukprot:TRINITY_DN36220_c0_g1_i1.p1 TRINITY_DN36220_c0_g1~~TRINITY_DN36220_c0_g1_i1.p1  ORF type:complete len:344 (-),score=67.02 TRINITY_DN36220_c0_g1_i1:623-1552(-)